MDQESPYESQGVGNGYRPFGKTSQDGRFRGGKLYLVSFRSILVILALLVLNFSFLSVIFSFCFFFYYFFWVFVVLDLLFWSLALPFNFCHFLFFSLFVERCFYMLQTLLSCTLISLFYLFDPPFMLILFCECYFFRSFSLFGTSFFSCLHSYS